MPTASPFLVFSWKKAFIPQIKDYVLAATGGRPGSVTIITPGSRPWSYLVNSFRKEKKSLALPRMLPFRDLAIRWRSHIADAPAHMANMLDQAYLLKECVDKIAQADAPFAEQLAHMDMAHYLPWGLRLANLFEELFANGLPGRDLPYPDDAISEPAAKLLSALGRLGELWRQTLQERGWSTPGFDIFQAAENSGSIPPDLLPSAGRLVLIAGFSSLTGAQEKLFGSLWRAGAMVCLHGDPALALDLPHHSACDLMQAWARKWSANFMEAPGKPDSHEPEFNFYAAYDGHSQLEQMVCDLAGADTGKGQSVIVLPDSGRLVPLLHELPHGEINITMGYPLARSPLADLLKLVFAPKTQGKYYWKDVIRLFNHPFVNMLEPGGAEAAPTFREALARIKEQARSGAKNVDLDEVMERITLKYPDSTNNLLRKVKKLLLDDPEHIKTAADLAGALANVADLLIAHGGRILSRFPFDMEAMARLREGVIPMLASNALANEELPPESLFWLFNYLLDGERISFEAVSDAGVQIMGLAETRMLNFERVFIMDASDDALPGQTPQDPLLPDSLRPLLGLARGVERQEAAGYNLFRLCAGARDVFFYWAEGAAPGAMSSAKKFRSRFVERIIWHLQSLAGQGNDSGSEDFLRVAVSRANNNKKQPDAIKKDGILAREMADIINAGVSASLLESYLACPKRFCMERLLRLQPALAVNEDDDPAQTGSCVHSVLEELFKAKKGEIISDAMELRGSLLEILEEKSEGLKEKLPCASWLAFKTAAPIRLEAYLRNFPNGAKIIDCEKWLEAAFDCQGQMVKARAKIDRIDERADGIHIIDYKTGTPQAIARDLANDGQFSADMRNCLESDAVFDEMGEGVFMRLAREMPDPQLPLYALLWQRITGEFPADAAYVALKENGREEPLFGKMDKQGRVDAMDFYFLAFKFILKHMAKSPYFYPNPDGGLCAWCPMIMACGGASRICQ